MEFALRCFMAAALISPCLSSSSLLPIGKSSLVSFETSLS